MSYGKIEYIYSWREKEYKRNGILNFVNQVMGDMRKEWRDFERSCEMV